MGHSIIFTCTAAALKPTADLIRNIEPLIAGDRLAPVETAQKLARRFRLLGPEGLLGMALAAIDMAIWGCPGTQSIHFADRPGVAKPVPAYGAVGYDGATGSARCGSLGRTRLQRC